MSSPFREFVLYFCYDLSLECFGMLLLLFLEVDPVLIGFFRS